jgi:L-alanine-DL-glutamate epimerase-like enolase superfamily enzyme
MLDANNGYNLALAKELLAQTAPARVHWLEEPFHEDPKYLEALQTWLDDTELPTLIADGEGDASPHLLDWARDGLINVVQYDLLGYGLGRWAELAGRLDAWGVGSGPHHYGALLGNYYTGHLAAAAARFTFVEWDHAEAIGLDASAYRVTDGAVELPEAPGFGLALDEAVWRQAVAEGGFVLKA